MLSDVSGQQETTLYFAGVAAVCSFNAVALFLAVRESTTAEACTEYENRYRGFKWVRSVGYAALVVLQLSLFAARLASHWLDVSWIDAAQSLVLLLYVMTLAVLCQQWPRQLSLKLSGVLLLALLEPGLLFAEDITVVNPGGALDAEHIARVVIHGVQIVLLVSLLISEVIIQQHQLLQRGTFSRAVSGGSPRSCRQQTNGHQHGYQPLSGGVDMERGKSREFTLWRPGDSRWSMAASAFHYVWPTTGILRARLAACFVLITAERAINLAAPVAFKHMVELLGNVTAAAATAAAAHPEAGPITLLQMALRSLLVSAQATDGSAQLHAAGGMAAVANTTVSAAAGTTAAGGMEFLAPFWTLFYPWALIYLGAFFLRGGSGSEGLLANIRDILYIPITQAAFCRISCDVFRHLLDLDLNFHVHRKTGQIMRILDRGTSSIQDTVSIVLFNVIPQMIDVVVACAYLATRMQLWVAGIVMVTVSSYVPLTVIITERRGKIRKVMNALDNERESRATDVLLNYETVKYFCNEAFELAGYDKATRRYQAAEYWQLAFLSLLSMVQSMVVWVGLAGGLVVCIWGCSRGTLTVGDTVLFITMMQQLYVPLTYFGSYYRQVQKALIDMENMFELLATRPAVIDEPGATTLCVTEGRVDFKDVIFSYNPNIGQPVLKGVTFGVPGGKSLAVVGSTGSGKSTLLRLLLRFYDPQSGAVLIDSQNIRHCKQLSVRAAIAVVPQDTVLFNDTIMYNIKYGRTTAGDSQVYEAAEIAHIHQHLSRFPHGYSTRVGERGLRLSGGEKQRVAFARAVLKGPAILVLDEATSALDSLTEKLVQDSLTKIRGRCTQLIVAHRLSTVMDADQILVVDRGKVAEHGTHAELIEAGGRYASMWFRQQDFSSTSNAASNSFTGGITPVPTVAGAADSPTTAAAKHGTAENSSPLASVGAERAAIHQSPVQLLQLDLADEEQQQQIEQQGSLEPSMSPGLSPRADLRVQDTSPILGLQGTGPAGIRLSQSGGLPPRHEDSVGNLGGAGRRVPDGRVTLPRYRILRRNESGLSSIDGEHARVTSPDIGEDDDLDNCQHEPQEQTGSSDTALQGYQQHP